MRRFTAAAVLSAVCLFLAPGVANALSFTLDPMAKIDAINFGTPSSLTFYPVAGNLSLNLPAVAVILDNGTVYNLASGLDVNVSLTMALKPGSVSAKNFGVPTVNATFQHVAGLVDLEITDGSGVSATTLLQANFSNNMQFAFSNLNANLSGAFAQVAGHPDFLNAFGPTGDISVQITMPGYSVCTVVNTSGGGACPPAFFQTINYPAGLASSLSGNPGNAFVNGKSSYQPLAAPEPSLWLLSLLGLGAIGVARRR